MKLLFLRHIAWEWPRLTVMFGSSRAGSKIAGMTSIISGYVSSSSLSLSSSLSSSSALPSSCLIQYLWLVQKLLVWHWPSSGLYSHLHHLCYIREILQLRLFLKTLAESQTYIFTFSLLLCAEWVLWRPQTFLILKILAGKEEGRTENWWGQPSSQLHHCKDACSFGENKDKLINSLSN